jgi:hypothetical protein
VTRRHVTVTIIHLSIAFWRAVIVPFVTRILSPGFSTHSTPLFTTHTAVTAGFDRFHPDLMHKYLHRYTEEELFIPLEDMLAGKAESSDIVLYLAGVNGCGLVQWWKQAMERSKFSGDNSVPFRIRSSLLSNLILTV